MLQKDRVYKLTIGDAKTGNGVIITELEVKFDISKLADNKKRGNASVIDVYNLSPSTLSLLESSYITCEFMVGYASSGPKVVVKGNVVEVSTTKQGVDRVTRLTLGEGYTELNHGRLAGVVPPGKTIKEVIDEIRQQMPGVAMGAMTGVNCYNPVTFGYPLHGTAKQALDKICAANKLEWRIDNNALYINDENGIIDKNLATAPVISEQSGLVDIPFRTSAEGRRLPTDKRRTPGIQFTALMNADYVPGTVVRVESRDISGWYRINSARYYGDFRGNEWYVDCFCGIILEDDLK